MRRQREMFVRADFVTDCDKDFFGKNAVVDAMIVLPSQKEPD